MQPVFFLQILLLFLRIETIKCWPLWSFFCWLPCSRSQAKEFHQSHTGCVEWRMVGVASLEHVIAKKYLERFLCWAIVTRDAMCICSRENLCKRQFLMRNTWHTKDSAILVKFLSELLHHHSKCKCTIFCATRVPLSLGYCQTLNLIGHPQAHPSWILRDAMVDIVNWTWQNLKWV